MADLCECGCGAEAPLATKTDRRRGHVKGQPIRFIRGHNAANAVSQRRRYRPAAAAERLSAMTAAPDQDGCMIWLGNKASGYGRFWLSGRLVSAHRAAYEVTHGPIPAGHDIHHVCGNPTCVNVAHLEPLIPSEHKSRHSAKLGRALVKNQTAL